MIGSILPAEATHSSLDLFEKAPLLITFDSAFEQEIGPLYSPNGPVVEFEVVGNRNQFIDLQKIFLEVKWQILNVNGTPIQATGDDAGRPKFV